MGLSPQAPTAGPYKVLKTAKVGGEGGYDYIFADVEGRRLYIPRGGPSGQLMVFNLDTLESVGAVAEVRTGGATVDPKSHHGFSTTKPLTMWDATTLKVIKTIDVDGHPDGILCDPYNARVWVLSHQPPHATVIDAAEGTVVKTLDLGGAPEQAVSDGKGTIYVNIADKANIAVVDAKNLTVTAHYDMSSKGTGGSGLAFDAKNHVLFAYYRQPTPTVVIVNADNGNLIATLPTGMGVDTVAFNPATMEAISAEYAGSMTFIKENSPTSFVVEQTLQTMVGAKTLALDTKTNHLLTMAAEFGPPPPDAPSGPAGRPARGPMVPGSFSILMVGK
jgi:DNA-binding beta-propeller fold protein YncE